jgi:hypothetical protein
MSDDLTLDTDSMRMMMNMTYHRIPPLVPPFCHMNV